MARKRGVRARCRGERVSTIADRHTRAGEKAMPTHLQNHIDGRWVDSVSGDKFDDTDPANGDLIATVTKSSTADVDRAVEAAHRAFDAWRLVPAPKRGEILYRAGE